MSRGLSKQQQVIMATLRTGKFKEQGYSTIDLLYVLHSDYLKWDNPSPFGHQMRHREMQSIRELDRLIIKSGYTLPPPDDAFKMESYRVSVFRALKNLEKRGLVKCYTQRKMNNSCHRGHRWAPIDIWLIEKVRINE